MSKRPRNPGVELAEAIRLVARIDGMLREAITETPALAAVTLRDAAHQADHLRRKITSIAKTLKAGKV